jgi:hypothetical protein
MSLEFYKNLKPFNNFNEFHSPNHYKQVPGNWNLIITDVKGSTQSIQSGRYRDVNTLGVASIVVVRKILKRKDFPFVFGGDGATIVLPPEETNSVIPSLLGLKKIASDNFGMELRIGIVSIEEILSSGKTIEMARFFLSSGFSQAMLRGSGITYGEKLIKENYNNYQARSELEIEPDLTGLTCRWKPIPTQRGKILTLLIRPREGNEKVYTEILNEFNTIFPEGLEKLNPATYDKNNYRSVWESIQNEFRLRSSKFSFQFLLHALTLIPTYFLFNLRIPFPKLMNYIRSTASHSDFRKFDDMLRMVIDCSDEEVVRIKLFLDDLFQKGLILYGTHISQNSLMTCYVEGLNEGQHIHFLDAENGGYTEAAIQMKNQKVPS